MERTRQMRARPAAPTIVQNVTPSKTKAESPSAEIYPYKILGDLPDLNSAFHTLLDHEKGQVILYGTHCETGKISIHLIEWASRLSTDIGREMLHLSRRGELVADVPLPHVEYGALSFARVGGTRYIFLFGGSLLSDRENLKQRTVVSDTYWFNLDQREWSQITPELPDSFNPSLPSPRVGAACVSIGDRIYIFGGHVPLRSDGSILSSTRSYSVAWIILGPTDMNGRRQLKWKWTVVDKPYPKDIMSLGFMGGAFQLRRGTILLTPGSGETESVRLSESNLVVYDLEEDKFTSLPTGDLRKLPRAVTWYVVTPAPTATQILSNPPKGVSFIVLTNQPVIRKNDPISPQLWLMTIYRRVVRVQEIVIAPRLNELPQDDSIYFFTLCCVRGRLGLLGCKGEQPTNGSAYLAEIQL